MNTDYWRADERAKPATSRHAGDFLEGQVQYGYQTSQEVIVL
jgi:hypothetical protein